MTSDNSQDDLKRFIAETDAVEAAIRAAVRDTLLEHKRAGLPVVVERDGQPYWMPAEEIEVDDLPNDSQPDR